MNVLSTMSKFCSSKNPTYSSILSSKCIHNCFRSPLESRSEDNSKTAAFVYVLGPTFALVQLPSGFLVWLLQSMACNFFYLASPVLFLEHLHLNNFC